ncbi:hypothetical protein JOM56_014714 [Amanita muscaria]
MFNFKRGVQRLLRFLAFSWGLVTTPMDQTQTYTGLMAVPSTGHALASFVPAFGTSTKTRRMDPSFPQRTARLPKGIPLRSKMRRMDSAGSESFRQRMARLSKGVVVRSLGTPTIAQASVSIEEYLKRLCLEDGALDGPLSDHDWSDNEKQAFYGPLSECEASDAEDGMPQSKVAPIEDCLQKHLQNKALDGPLSDRDRSDDEEQAFYGPLRECEVSDTEDGMPQSKGAPIEDFLQKHLQNKALDCPLSDHDRSDDEEQAFYGPLSECEASEIGDSLPQSKDAHAIKKLEHWKRQLVRKREKRRKNRKRQQEDRGTGLLVKSGKKWDCTGTLPGLLVFYRGGDLAGNTAKLHQASTGTLPGLSGKVLAIYQDFTVITRYGNYISTDGFL